MESWNDALCDRDWSKLDRENDLDKKVDIFTKLVTEALDNVAPMSTFTVRTNHVFGLSDKTKDLMKKRDLARKKVSR